MFHLSSPAGGGGWWRGRGKGKGAMDVAAGAVRICSALRLVLCPREQEEA